jgi:hypothetical protein
MARTPLKIPDHGWAPTVTAEKRASSTEKAIGK